MPDRKFARDGIATPQERCHEQKDVCGAIHGVLLLILTVELWLAARTIGLFV
jgi:hypothetical protein